MGRGVTVAKSLHGVKLASVSLDLTGNWYIAGEEEATHQHKVWRIPYTLDKTEEIFAADALSIDVYSSYGSTYVFAIVDNEVRMYGTPGNRRSPHEGDFVIIQKADDNHEWRGLVFDTSAKFLYVTDRKMNQVYRFDPTSPGYPRKMVAGNPDGRPADDATHLDHPEGVKFANGDLYILQGSSEGGRVVRWTPDEAERTFVYDFLVNGRLGFDVADVTEDFIYYRTSDNSVYKHCVNSPCNEPIIIVGGCGAGHDRNQIVNAGSGALEMDYSGKLLVWDFGGERFVHWANRDMLCPEIHCDPLTTTTPSTTTTASTTRTTTTTSSTTPSTTSTSTSSSTTPSTTTSTTTSTTPSTTTSTTTSTTPSTTTSTTTSTTPSTTTSTTTSTTPSTTTSTTTSTTPSTTTSTTTSTTPRVANWGAPVGFFL
ncbi:hypothetical protein FOZ60_012260 [Perkinsus olseni]|uniref:Uncharacterized protein n=1 Tax=Perkinsus olseni TaxID=32597 RepID=A0A7J6NCW7_PEROL|nr:hypothetical protein FOZ60_012260 [Perkinsus olseni]